MAEQAPVGQGSQAWYVGDDFAQPFEVVDASGVAVDITGWTMDWNVKREYGAPNALITKTSGAGGVVITNAASGLLEVRIAAADTASLPPGAYVHTLRRTDSGHIRTLAQGPALLSRNAAV